MGGRRPQEWCDYNVTHGVFPFLYRRRGDINVKECTRGSTMTNTGTQCLRNTFSERVQKTDTGVVGVWRWYSGIPVKPLVQVLSVVRQERS